MRRISKFIYSIAASVVLLSLTAVPANAVESIGDEAYGLTWAEVDEKLYALEGVQPQERIDELVHSGEPVALLVDPTADYQVKAAVYTSAVTVSGGIPGPDSLAPAFTFVPNGDVVTDDHGQTAEENTMATNRVCAGSIASASIRNVVGGRNVCQSYQNSRVWSVNKPNTNGVDAGNLRTSFDVTAPLSQAGSLSVKRLLGHSVGVGLAGR